MMRMVAGELVAWLGTTGKSLHLWSKIVRDMRQVLRQVVNEDLNAKGGDGWEAEEEFDFDRNNNTD